MGVTNTPEKTENELALFKALLALKIYEHGSSRSALLPIDEAVAHCHPRTSASQTLEGRLLDILTAKPPEPAREYILGKLAMFGTDHSVAAIAACVSDDPVATAARNALESIPGTRATKALIGLLAMTSGVKKIGIINSLGSRKDADSVRALAQLLPENDKQIISATLAALGRSGSLVAAKAIRNFPQPAPADIQPALTDAALTCASLQFAERRLTEARELYELVANSPAPPYARQMAIRNLLAC